MWFVVWKTNPGTGIFEISVPGGGLKPSYVSDTEVDNTLRESVANPILIFPSPLVLFTDTIPLTA